LRTQLAGRRGEAAALAYLRRAGLRLIKRNFRCKTGEIDLIMRDRSRLQPDILVFIEVRYRAGNSHGGAAASVTHHKRQRLIRTARRYLQQHPGYNAWPCRFDVVALSGSQTEPQLQWIPHAFDTNSAPYR